MDNAWQHLILAVVALAIMCLAAIVQSTIGLTSIQRIRQFAPAPKDTREDAPRHRSVQSLVDPRRILAASMILLQVLMAILATGELIRVFEAATDNPLRWLAMAIVAAVFIVFGLALPRALASKQLDRFLVRALRLGHIATILLVPLNWIVEQVAKAFLRVLPGEDAEPDTFGLEEELRPNRFERDDQVIGADEQVMMNGILSLEEMTVRDIMVPRLDIVAVERTVNPSELIETIVKAGHSRIPVYQESVDRIIGVLYAKDLLPFVIGNTNRIPLLDLIRPAFVVPESKRLNVLFAELRRDKIHLAIVADEYGGTAGLVTIEDILEEIVGEIQDEYDTEQPLFEPIGPVEILADGRLPIENVENYFGMTFPEDADYESVGGFVQNVLGRMPREGDRFAAEGIEGEIIEVEGRRVRRLRLARQSPPSDFGEIDTDRESPDVPPGEDSHQSRSPIVN